MLGSETRPNTDATMMLIQPQAHGAASALDSSLSHIGKHVSVCREAHALLSSLASLSSLLAPASDSSDCEFAVRAASGSSNLHRSTSMSTLLCLHGIERAQHPQCEPTCCKACRSQARLLELLAANTAFLRLPAQHVLPAPAQCTPRHPSDVDGRACVTRVCQTCL